MMMMMMTTVLRLASVFAVTIPFAASSPNYALPKELAASSLAESGCSLPETFDLQNFQTWAPAAGSNASLTIQFGYSDNTTNIHSYCQYNSTSKNVAGVGRTARYACDDSSVQFIWQNGTLTLIEKTCPGSSGSAQYEASGSVKPKTECVTTDCDYPDGDGTQCLAVSAHVRANFSSLDPIRAA